MSVSGLQLGLMAGFALAAFAGEPALRRDGAFWVEESRGSALVAPNGHIRITTFGAVKLTVDNRDCVCDVSEVPDECPALIGQVHLELMDFVVDPDRRQLIGNPAYGGEQLIELL